MRRLALSLTVVLLLVLGAGYRHSAAEDITVFNGACFAGPSNTLIPCSTLTPTATPSLPTPVKDLKVGPAVPGPAGTTSYLVTLTSKFECFALNEPISVLALGSPGAAALTPLFPNPGVVPSAANAVTTKVDTASGQARLNLEVHNASVGPEGLLLKAEWPVENVDRFATVIKPAGAGTATPAPTATPGATGSTTVPTVAGPFNVQACMQPPVLPGSDLEGGTGTLYGLTAPGATCTAGISYYANPHTYLGGPSANEFNGGSQTASTGGLVAYKLTEDHSGDYGLALVTCAPAGGGSTITACAAFLLAQKGTKGLLSEGPEATASRLVSLQDAYCPAHSVHT